MAFRASPRTARAVTPIRQMLRNLLDGKKESGDNPRGKLLVVALCHGVTFPGKHQLCSCPAVPIVRT